MDLSKTPPCLEHYALDEVSECISGITPATHNELWELLMESERAGTDKPIGGDGSEGTTEEPIVSSGEYGSDLVAGWPRLSEEARRNIWEAVAQRQKEEDELFAEYTQSQRNAQ